MCDDLQTAGSGHVGEANMFLSHAWGNQFIDTVDAALGAATERQLALGGVVYFWIDIFSTSQHSALNIPSIEWMRMFREAINKMGSLAMVLQPWNDPLALKRAWLDDTGYYKPWQPPLYVPSSAFDSTYLFVSGVYLSYTAAQAAVDAFKWRWLHRSGIGL
jgi:hypothetical protein